MKLLLDENLPHQIRLELTGHEIITAAFMKWSGIENGELLRRAAEAGFDALLTNDRDLEHEQNLDAIPISVVVLLAKANTIESIRPLYPLLLAALDQLQPRRLIKIEAM